jgi:hypothetical protein
MAMDVAVTAVDPGDLHPRLGVERPLTHDEIHNQAAVHPDPVHEHVARSVQLVGEEVTQM